MRACVFDQVDVGEATLFQRIKNTCQHWKILFEDGGNIGGSEN